MIRALLIAITLLLSPVASAQTSFVTFESGHVRPIAASPDGTQVFAVNTPDNRLEVYDVVAAVDSSTSTRSRSAWSRSPLRPATTTRSGS